MDTNPHHNVHRRPTNSPAPRPSSASIRSKGNPPLKKADLRNTHKFCQNRGSFGVRGGLGPTLKSFPTPPQPHSPTAPHPHCTSVIVGKRQTCLNTSLTTSSAFEKVKIHASPFCPKRIGPESGQRCHEAHPRLRSQVFGSNRCSNPVTCLEETTRAAVLRSPGGQLELHETI